MAECRFKGNFGQCQCQWCGLGRYGRLSGGCKVTEDIRKALRRFQKEHGRSWKAKLRQAWESGANISAELQTYRNICGPRRLELLPSRLVERVEIE